MSLYLDPVEYSRASNGLRFANYLIDFVVLRVLTFGLAFLVGSMVYLEETIPFLIISTLIELVIFVLFYTFQELLMKGRTIGKFITGTKAVTVEGNDLDFTTALIRSLCRLIPFEPFSFFGETGWHDSISKTRVVNQKDFEQNKAKFNSIDQIGQIAEPV